MQRPPQYSAVKVDGRRAYAIARAGGRVELEPRQVNVSRFEQLARDGDRRRFVIECSSGTYVRTLIAELGDAYCEALRRTRIGGFDVADAGAQRPIPLMRALAFLPEVTLDSDQGRRAAHGQALALDELAVQDPPRGDVETVRLVDPDGLVGLAQRDPTGATLRIAVGLRG